MKWEEGIVQVFKLGLKAPLFCKNIIEREKGARISLTEYVLRTLPLL
jgi:hypothetical protein